jgi:hypothetical protein
MHQTIILPSSRSYFDTFPVRLAHFLSSIEVGNTRRRCSGSEQTNAQDDLPARRRFGGSIQGILGFQQRPQLLEVELYCRRNAASATMVRLADDQKRA